LPKWINNKSFEGYIPLFIFDDPPMFAMEKFIFLPILMHSVKSHKTPSPSMGEEIRLFTSLSILMHP